MSFEIDWLKKWSRYSPHSVAFKDADSSLEFTYGSLYFLACRLARHLAEQLQIRKGDRIAVLATNEMEYLPLFFAAQRLGAILVPMNFRLTGRELSHILEDSQPAILIHQDQFSEVIDTIDASVIPTMRWLFDANPSRAERSSNLSAFISSQLEFFKTENIAENIRRETQDWMTSFESQPEDPCMILYTSGTTGAPKGAIITGKMLHWNSLNTTMSLNIQQSDVALGFLPFFHTGGWNVLLTPLVHRGGRTVLLRKFDAQRVLDLCSREKVSVLFGVPTTMDLMARAPNFASADLSSLRFAIVGGEPMPLQLIHTWQSRGIRIRQGFGMTEFGPGVFSLNAEDAIRKIGSIGFANFYVETRVIDNNGRDVQQGEVGELLLRGPVCTPGYWENPEATAATIKNGWLYTGDLVRYDDEGYFYVAGRKKDMFISGGENVYPVEVERFLGTHPAVREVAVIGVPDAKWGEVGKAFVALKSGCSLTESDLLTFCVGQLATYKTPKSVVFLADLPKGDSGKILKRALKEPASP
jgi:fatty-acyl-CoA synthase